MTLALENRIADLEEQVAYWKSEAGISADVNQKAILQMRLKLTSTSAWLLQTLYRANGKAVRRTWLAENVDRGIREINNENNVLAVQISRMRKCLPPGSIITHRGGYGTSNGSFSLSPDAISYIAGILE